MTKRRCVGMLAAAVIGGAFPALVWGQAAEEPAARSEPPGEEVMRPTQRGIRLTPGMATGGMRLWFQNDDLWRDADLSEEQERKLADAAARRLMSLARRDGQEGRSAMEYLVETGLATQMKVNADNCREFGEKVQPLARSMRDMLEGTAEDARSILTDEQWARVQPGIELRRRAVEQFGRRLEGYREGRVGESENPFDELDVSQESPNRPKVDQRVRNARRMVDWEVRRRTAGDWSRFLAGAVMLFKYDDAQKAKGEALLAEYRKKADAIQTPEWKERVRRNGMMMNLRWQLGDAPKAPWVFRLQKQYDDDLRPLEELRDAFYKEVLGIATPQQRAEALDDARAVMEKHGLSVADTDISLLQGLLQ